jgi:histidine triad (HIT) family protein
MSPNDIDSSCIFCKIINGDIPAGIVYKDHEIIIFKDINPSAPVHLIVVPLRHIVSLTTMQPEDTPIIGKMTAAANKIAKEMGLAARGYRLIINTGPDGGQVVQHLHMHLLGGRELKWEQ